MIKKSIWSKIFSIGLILSMTLAMFPVTSLSAATEIIEEEGPINTIPDLGEVITENSSELAGIIDFIEGAVPGYGSNGRFLAPIEAPASNATPIYTAQDLDNVRNDLTGSYKLMNDIDLSGYISDQWVPIGLVGLNSTAFSGTFDGQGYVIKNLRITGSAYQYSGLFGYVNDAEIKNVGFDNAYIDVYRSSSSYAGSICGLSSGSSFISNCYNMGNFSFDASSSDSITGYYAGGICGFSYGWISNCYNTGSIAAYSSSLSTVSSSSTVGGICGMSRSQIYYCYNTGCISASDTVSAQGSMTGAEPAVGGICGITQFGSISNCYNTGEVSAYSSSTYVANSMVGGICASNAYGAVSYCYSSGNVYAYSNKTSFAGGICGINRNSGFISNCVVLSNKIEAEVPKSPNRIYKYLIGFNSSGTIVNNLALSDISGDATNDATRLLSLDEAKDQCTYADLEWNFMNIWQMDPGHDYPQLRHELILKDTSLNSLTISQGILSPAFNADITSYTVSVANDIVDATISATTNNMSATLTGTGSKTLNVGDNSFDIVVTAQDGTKKTYTIRVNRAAPPSNDAKLLDLTISTDDDIVQISPSFDPDKISYTASVSYEVSNATISAVANHPEAVFIGAGLKSLEVGANAFAIEVTAEDGTTNTYTVTINRTPPSSDTSLSNLSISPGTLDPDFQADITSYTVSVPYEIEEIIVMAEANHPAATIAGDGQKELEVGDNLFEITVNAQDGSTKTYTIVVTREPQPQLINLILSAGELDPYFDPDITNYIVSVPGEINTISITALVGGSGINIGFSQGGAHQIENQWFSDSFNLDTAEKMITVYVYKDGLLQASYSITIMCDLVAKPIYKWEATGDIGTIGRVLFDIPDDKNFLDKYALVCDDDINIEIYFSPKRTENAIAAGQNTYVFAVRLPNGETNKDISFSFKPVGGAVTKNKIIVYGDINEDGTISTTDATLVTRWAGGNTATVLGNILAADVNGDAYITTTDATLVTRRAGGNISPAFSIETRF